MAEKDDAQLAADGGAQQKGDVVLNVELQQALHHHKSHAHDQDSSEVSGQVRFASGLVCSTFFEEIG
jgi:hypothetical protein